MHILINIFGRKAYVKKIKIKPNWNSMVLSVVRPAAIANVPKRSKSYLGVENPTFQESNIV